MRNHLDSLSVSNLHTRPHDHLFLVLKGGFLTDRLVVGHKQKSTPNQSQLQSEESEESKSFLPLLLVFLLQGHGNTYRNETNSLFEFKAMLTAFKKGKLLIPPQSKCTAGLIRKNAAVTRRTLRWLEDSKGRRVATGNYKFLSLRDEVPVRSGIKNLKGKRKNDPVVLGGVVVESITRGLKVHCGYYSTLTARTHAGFRHPESMIRQLETIDGWIPDE